MKGWCCVGGEVVYKNLVLSTELCRGQFTLSTPLIKPNFCMPYKKARDARRKFYIKPLKETNLVVAQAFFDP